MYYENTRLITMLCAQFITLLNDTQIVPLIDVWQQIVYQYTSRFSKGCLSSLKKYSKKKKNIIKLNYKLRNTV